MRGLLAVAALALIGAAPADRDPLNPTCPRQMGWTSFPEMRFTLKATPTGRALIAEGVIDEGAPQRLEAALKANAPIDEIWLRSPGGDAAAGNAGGRIIRKAGIPTRIPAGWACFSACNFLFMGGPIRAIDPGGQFAVHMFTFTQDEGVRERLIKGKEGAVAAVSDVEQGSAMLATDDNDFLIRMGVSRKLLTDIMYTQKAVGAGDRGTRRCLTLDEAFRYNVANLRQ